MFRVPITWLTVVFMGIASACVNAAEQPGAASSTAASSSSTPSKTQPRPSDSRSDDEKAARELLDLANQARAQAGVAPLQLNQALSQAAGAHAAEMAAQQQLSHQFSGEPSLWQRLTANASLRLDRAGENVAFAPTVEQAHEALMHSAPHRENLLNPAFNLAGVSVVRSGKLLYVTQDLAHSLPSYSGEQADDAVVHAVSEARTQAGRGSLRRTAMSAARNAACSMAHAGSLDGPQLSGRHELRYTAFSPTELPAGAAKAVAGNDVQEFSVGTCYGQNSHDTQGMFYVVLVLK